MDSPQNEPNQPPPPLPQPQRDLIINEKTQAEQATFLERINPQTLLFEHGHRTNVSHFPYFAHWSDAFCGASLVAPDILLTAAHCGMSQHPLAQKRVRLRSESRTSGGITRVVVHQETHPAYNAFLHDYDFQLLKLNASALVNADGNESTGVAIVELNDNYYYPPVDAELTALGFGTTTPDASTGNSQVLMDVNLTYFPKDVCEAQYGPHRVPAATMMCMGVPGGGKDVCRGDSGGPIVDAHSGIQVAVTSWGNGCAQADHYGINARVSAATKWITQQICRLSSYPPDTCDKATMTSVLNRPPQPRRAGGTLPSPTLQTPNSGTLTLRVTIQHDKYPRETSWDLRHLDSFVQLYWQPFESVQTSHTVISQVFSDLPAGTYQLRMADQRSDGICCNYGQGSIQVTATTTTTTTTSHGDDDIVLWHHNGTFAKFLQLTIEVTANATIVSKDVTYNYTSPSEIITNRNARARERDNNDPATHDREWPGAFPKQTEPHAMTVNVKHDDFPHQVSSSHAVKCITSQPGEAVSTVL